MVVSINYQSKSKSRYICDSCNKKMSGDIRTALYVTNTKKYDLCNNCWKRIQILVEKHYIPKLKFKKKGDKE